MPVTAKADNSAEAIANFFMDHTPLKFGLNNTFFVTTFSLEQIISASIFRKLLNCVQSNFM
ncbi:hypothetical protein ACBO_29660 [Acinetobacter bouvetii]|nr:hypothetical protein ACBO_29660 [Acinetobacter bouvetii]